MINKLRRYLKLAEKIWLVNKYDQKDNCNSRLESVKNVDMIQLKINSMVDWLDQFTKELRLN